MLSTKQFYSHEVTSGINVEQATEAIATFHTILPGMVNFWRWSWCLKTAYLSMMMYCRGVPLLGAYLWIVTVAVLAHTNLNLQSSGRNVCRDIHETKARE